MTMSDDPTKQSSPTPTTLRADVIMHRNQSVLENSDYYKKASPEQKVKAHAYFYKRFVIPVNQQLGTNITMKDYIASRSTKKDPNTGEKVHQNQIANQTSTFDKVMTGVHHGVLGEVKAIADVTRAAIPPEYKKQDEQLWKDYEESDDHLVAGAFQDNLRDRVLQGVTTGLAQSPAFALTDGILGETGVSKILGPLSKAGGVGKIAAKSIEGAAQGYLVGSMTGDSPGWSAASFAVMNPAFSVLGKMFVWGGGKLITKTLTDAAENITKKEAEGAVAPPIVGLAGSQKQRIRAATVEAVRHLSDGKYWGEMNDSQKAFVMKKLAKQAPDMANEIATVDKVAAAYQSAKEVHEARIASPQLNNVLSSLEKLDGKPTHETVADATQKIEKNTRTVKAPLSNPEIKKP